MTNEDGGGPPGSSTDQVKEDVKKLTIKVKANTGGGQDTSFKVSLSGATNPMGVCLYHTQRIINGSGRACPGLVLSLYGKPDLKQHNSTLTVGSSWGPS